MKTNLVTMAASIAMAFGLQSCNSTTQSNTQQPGVDSPTAYFKSTNDTLFWDADSVCACDNSERWGTPSDSGGIEISPDQGKDAVRAWHDRHAGIEMRGGFISKMALDSMFCHWPDYNGIYCYMGMNAKGKEVMIIEGIHLVDKDGKSAVDVHWSDMPADRFRVFATETMCPSVCGYCGTW